MKSKVRSFTLAELLVVMVITAIVIGMAFTVLRLVQKQIAIIQKNTAKSETMVLLEQQFWQDFNSLETIDYDSEKKILLLTSQIDTADYRFKDDFILRNTDTFKLKTVVVKALFNGKQVSNGPIDALSISAAQEIPDYLIFVSRKNDATFFMNNDGI